MMEMILGILLVILKVIGWFLLGILGLLLLLLLIVLFVPLRYKADAEYGEPARAYVRITWLLRLMQADLRYVDKKLKITYRILWIRKQMGEKEAETSAHAATAKDTAEVESPAEELPVDAQPERMEKPKVETSEAVPEADMTTPVQETVSETEAVEAPQEKITWAKRLLDKIQSLVQNIREKFVVAIEKFRSICTNIREKKEKMEALLLKFQTYPGKQELMRLFKKELFYILKKIRPRKLMIDMEFGMEDPSVTGLIMAGYGIITSLWSCKGYSMMVAPDFENKVLQGNIHLKGRVALYVFAFPALRIILNKRVRKLIKDIKKIREDF